MGYRKFKKGAAFAALFAFFFLGVRLESCLLSGEGNISAALGQEAASITRVKIEIIGASRRINLDVEIARSVDEQARGLMFRRRLERGHGMLFLYGSPQEINMWMRNTYIALDMVFLRADGRVHRIASNTEPFSEEIIKSFGDVTAVLEIGAGEASRLELQKGDQLIHSHFEQ